MPLEDMPQIQVPQISNMPEPVSQMPKIDPNITKSLDDLTIATLDGLGKVVATVAIMTASKAVDGVANGVERATNRAGDYDTNHIAGGSPEMGRGNKQEGPSQGISRDVTDSQQVGASQAESLGVRSEGRNATQISGATHVSDHDYGNLQSNINFGKGPSQDRGVGGP